jgi:hypothetical protein
MNNTITSNKKKCRLYIIILLLVLTLFIPYIKFNEFKIEWHIIFLIFILMDLGLLIIEKKKIKLDTVSIGIIIFYIYNLLLFCINMYGMDKEFLIGFMHFGRASIMLLYYFWIINTFDQVMINELISKIIKILFIFAIIINIDYLFFQKFISFYGRDSLEFINYGKNMLGYISVLSLLFVIKNVKKRIKKIIIVILFGHIIILTNSDAAILALLVIIIYNLFIIKKAKKIEIQILYKLLILILILISLVYFGNRIIKTDVFINLYKFFKTTLNKGISKSTESVRFDVQTYFLRNPNWNPTIGNYYYAFFSKFKYTMHNQFAQMLNDTGIIGLSIFIYLVYSMFSKISTKYYEFFIIIFMYSFIENFFFQYIPLLLLFILINIQDTESKYIKENYDI